MNLPTTRFAMPAAAPRIGRSPIGLPRDEGLDRLLADRRLGSTAKTIAVALVKHWAWSKPSCWPSDKTIATKIGKSPGHVQRCMRELEAAAWIVREHTDDVPTGRRIWLAWRGTPGAGAARDAAPARRDRPAPARNERVVVVKERNEPENSAIFERQRSEADFERQRSEAEVTAPALLPPALPSEPLPLAPPPHGVPRTPYGAIHTPTLVGVPEPTVEPEPSLAPAPVPVVPIVRTTNPNPLLSIPLTPEQQARLAEMPAAARDQVLLWLATGDLILVREAHRRLAPPRPRPVEPGTLPELLSRVREDPSFPSKAADWLARAFDDWKSYSGFKARCEEAWRGEIEVSQLLSAYRQATGPKAKNRGAVFMHVLRE